MIFFLSSLIFASALQYPSWGDWRYAAETLSYNSLTHQPGCASTKDCEPLRSGSFTGLELDVCLKSAKKGCTFIAYPNTDLIRGVSLPYLSWEERGNDLSRPSWTSGCNVTISDGTIYAATLQRFLDYFNTLPTKKLDIKGGIFRMTTNRMIESRDTLDLYLGNNRDLSKGCSALNLYAMTQLIQKDEWQQNAFADINYTDIIGKGSMLVSHYTRVRLDDDKDEVIRPLYVERMSFDFDSFIATLNDSAKSAISLSLLSLAFVTFIIN